MDVNKIRKICRPIRNSGGIIPHCHRFYLGVVPLIAGITNFCPLCIITKKCDLPEEANQTNQE